MINKAHKTMKCVCGHKYNGVGDIPFIEIGCPYHKIYRYPANEEDVTSEGCATLWICPKCGTVRANCFGYDDWTISV